MKRGIHREFKVRGGLTAHITLWSDDTVDFQVYRGPGRTSRDAIVHFTLDPGTALSAFLAQVEEDDWSWEDQ